MVTAPAMYTCTMSCKLDIAGSNHAQGSSALFFEITCSDSTCLALLESLHVHVHVHTHVYNNKNVLNDGLTCTLVLLLKSLLYSLSPDR